MNQPINRIFLTRLVTGYILFFLVIWYVQHMTVSRLSQPVMSYPGFDPGVWIFEVAGLSSIAQNKYAAFIFDSILFISGISALMFPLKRWVILIFAITLYLFGLLYKMYSLSNHQTLAGFMLIMFPFIIKNQNRFSLAWDGVRYFTCLIYFISFCWKISEGSILAADNGVHVIQLSMGGYLFNHPGTLFSSFLTWLLSHGRILNVGAILIFLMEGAMVIGFITKKFDHILFWLLIIIHLSTYFLIDISYLELLILDISLMPAGWIYLMSKHKTTAPPAL